MPNEEQKYHIGWLVLILIIGVAIGYIAFGSSGITGQATSAKQPTTMTKIINPAYGSNFKQGETFTVLAGVGCSGKTCSNVKSIITFNPSSGLRLPNNDATHTIGTMLDGETKLTSWLVSASSKGSYSLTVTTTSSSVLKSNNIISLKIFIPVCNAHSDCGTSGYVGPNYCIDKGVYKDYVTHTCNLAGTVNAYCTSSTTPIIQEACTYSCSNGACVNSRTPPCNSYGDVDSNGYVTSADSEIVSKYVAGLANLTAEQQRRADVNADASVTMADAMLIGQYANGIITTFKVCNNPLILSIVFVDPTPQSGSSVSSIYINTSITGSGHLSSFIDFNNSLLGYWRLDNNTDDSSGNGYNGYTTAGVNCGQAVEGYFGTGCSFNGLHGVVKITSLATYNWNLPGITVEAWIKPNLNDLQNVYGASSSFIRKNDLLAFDINNGTNTTRWETAGLFLFGNIALKNAVWQHVAGTYDTATGTIKSYVNGELSGSLSGGGVFGSAGTEVFYFGANGDSPGNLHYNGSLDEVRIWKRALSEQEIKASYSASSYRLAREFANLAQGDYNFYAYVTNLPGEVKKTETRTVHVS